MKLLSGVVGVTVTILRFEDIRICRAASKANKNSCGETNDIWLEDDIGYFFEFCKSHFSDFKLFLSKSSTNKKTIYSSLWSEKKFNYLT